MLYAGVAQLARASAFQAEGRGFEPRFPLQDLGAKTGSCKDNILPNTVIQFLVSIVVCIVINFASAKRIALIWLRGRALPW